MKEELTTSMHYELLKDEVSEDDIVIWGVYGAIRRGMTVEEACKKYNISVEHYEKRKHII